MCNTGIHITVQWVWGGEMDSKLITKRRIRSDSFLLLGKNTRSQRLACQERWQFFIDHRRTYLPFPYFWDLPNIKFFFSQKGKGLLGIDGRLAFPLFSLLLFLPTFSFPGMEEIRVESSSHDLYVQDQAKRQSEPKSQIFFHRFPYFLILFLVGFRTKASNQGEKFQNKQKKNWGNAMAGRKKIWSCEKNKVLIVMKRDQNWKGERKMPKKERKSHLLTSSFPGIGKYLFLREDLKFHSNKFPIFPAFQLSATAPLPLPPGRRRRSSRQRRRSQQAHRLEH